MKPRSVKDLVAAVAKLPAGHGSTRPGASTSEVSRAERSMGVKLPAELKAVLRASNGLSVALGTTAFGVEDVEGIAALAAESIYEDAFPKMLPVGDDGGQGIYLVALRGASLPQGSVLLTDRGSLLPEQTVIVAGSVLEALEAALAGDDPWKHPRQAARDPAASRHPTWDAYVAIELTFAPGGLDAWRSGAGRIPEAPHPQLLAAIGHTGSHPRVDECIRRLGRTFTITATGESFQLLGLLRKKGYWNAARDIAAIVTASADHGATGIALIRNAGSSITRDEAAVLRVGGHELQTTGLDERGVQASPEYVRMYRAAEMAAAVRSTRSKAQ